MDTSGNGIKEDVSAPHASLAGVNSRPIDVPAFAHTQAHQRELDKELLRYAVGLCSRDEGPFMRASSMSRELLFTPCVIFHTESSMTLCATHATDRINRYEACSET